MTHRTFYTWFVCLVCFSAVFATYSHPSSTPTSSKWSINNLFNRTTENPKTEDAQQEVQNGDATTSISSRSLNSDKAREPPSDATVTPNGPRSRTTPNDAGRQRFNDSPAGQPFNFRGEESDMMDPNMFWNPWALWGMRAANPWQRSTRSAPWNAWYRMNPMLSFWNQFGRSLANGNGYGYAEPYPNEYPGRYSRVGDGGYRPGRFPSYVEPESQETYRQPTASSYYRNQPAESSSPPYYRGQRAPQPAQPYYRNQRVEENAQSLPATARVSQNYRQQSAAPSKPNVRPPRNNAPAAREFRESSSNSKQPEKSVPFTLLYNDGLPSNSKASSPTSSEYLDQRTESNGQRERVENR